MSAEHLDQIVTILLVASMNTRMQFEKVFKKAWF